MEMVDRVRDTSESHDRCTVVEVMGRKAGYLALNAGIACGATSILIPEIEYDIQEHIIERMEKTQRTGKKHFIIIVSEGVTDAQTLQKQALNPVLVFSAIFSVAVRLLQRIEFLLLVWVTMQLSFL